MMSAQRTLSNVGLAERLSAALPRRPGLVDLSGDTGAMFPLLAPIIGRAQVWTFISRDGASLDDALASAALWAELAGFRVTWPSRAMLVHTPGGAWRIEGRMTRPGDPVAGLASLRPDAVVFDGLPLLDAPADIARLAGATRCALLANGLGAGRMRWAPRHRLDSLISRGVRQGQRRVARRVATPESVVRALTRLGMTVRVAPSEWRLTAAASRPLATLLEEIVDQARLGLPGRADEVGAWQDARARQLRRGRLAMHLVQRDILALPR